ncbi:hypothetical protein ALC62_08814, partial [Cyphomyrmex costatus]
SSSMIDEGKNGKGGEGGEAAEVVSVYSRIYAVMEAPLTREEQGEEENAKERKEEEEEEDDNEEGDEREDEDRREKSHEGGRENRCSCQSQDTIVDRGPVRRGENKVTSSVYVYACMCFYIRDEGGRGGYKEGTERKQERERGTRRRRRCGKEKRHGGRRERERERERESEIITERQSGERPRVRARDRDKRRRERRERGQPPLLPRVVTPNAGDISTNQITPRAPPFIIILLVFPLLHPHWMTFPGPYRGTKKAPAPRRGLHASSRGLGSSGTLLVPTLVQQRPPP